MASVTYTLKQPNTNGQSLIYFNFFFGKKQKIVLSSGKKIEPKFWQGDKKKKGCYRAKETRKFPIHPEFNRYLDNLETEAKNLFQSYQNEHGEVPTVETMKSILKNHINSLTIGKSEPKVEQKPEQPKTLLAATNELIKLCESGIRLTEQNKTYSENTLRGYKNTRNIIEKQWLKIKLEDVTLEFYNDFLEYMKTNSASNNTIGKHVKNIKVFMSYALESGYTTNNEFRSKYFKVLKEETDSIALSESDVDKLFNLDLTNNKRLDHVRDLFLLMCMTGLRVSDMKRLDESNIDRKNELIHVKAKKTSGRVAIPLLPITKAIIDKYTTEERGLVLNPISDQKMNEYIKEVGRMIDSFKNKTVSLYKGTFNNKKVYKTSTVAEELQNHVGRRTFCTIMYNLQIPVHAIMAVSGHKTQKAFFRYIKVSEIEHATMIKEAWQNRVQSDNIRKLG